ncbi:hypothetical protein ONZ45_g9827 [Pleurotus djamor]|nr:hypothetical protein ONZ45_g9827 [Pleurotus djamor]
MFAYASSPLDLVRPGIFSNKHFDSPSYPDSSSSTPPSAELASATNTFSQSFGVLDASPALGLPIYSATGFDLLSLLARVHNRPNQQVALGPVDLSCSFVVVDVRRHDRPIVFCSPTFCRLTGYTEAEIIGRNCRFLQAPGGAVVKGEPRKYTSNDEVSRMRKALHADKECQVKLVNFRKDGTAFMNLVTVIPLHGGEHGLAHEENEVYYHIGFQVDLNLQPHAMMERFKDGTYHASPGPPPATTHSAKKNQSAPLVLSKSLRVMLNDPAFIASLSSASSLSALQTDKSEPSPEPGQLFNTLLLSAIPDFIHVVSLKGLFLYVAPAVRKVLGYEPEELIGKSITDYCHPHDIVPLTRELKESSATSGQMHDAHVAHPSRPRTVDLLFRGLTKSGSYVWVECRGRLYVEPGKGRKAIILSGRARSMASLPWSDVPLGGGLNTSIRNTRAVVKPDDESVQVEVKETEREFWGSLSQDGVVLVAGQGVSAVMGWSGEEILGHSLVGYLAPGEDSAMNSLLEVLRGIHEGGGTEGSSAFSREDSQQGAQPQTSESSTASSSLVSPPSILPVPRAVLPAPVLFQLKTIDNLPCNHQAVAGSTSFSNSRSAIKPLPRKLGGSKLSNFKLSASHRHKCDPNPRLFQPNNNSNRRLIQPTINNSNNLNNRPVPIIRNHMIQAAELGIPTTYIH